MPKKFYCNNCSANCTVELSDLSNDPDTCTLRKTTPYNPNWYAIKPKRTRKEQPVERRSVSIPNCSLCEWCGDSVVSNGPGLKAAKPECCKGQGFKSCHNEGIYNSEACKGLYSLVVWNKGENE